MEKRNWSKQIGERLNHRTVSPQCSTGRPAEQACPWPKPDLVPDNSRPDVRGFGPGLSGWDPQEIRKGGGCFSAGSRGSIVGGQEAHGGFGRWGLATHKKIVGVAGIPSGPARGVQGVAGTGLTCRSCQGCRRYVSAGANPGCEMEPPDRLILPRLFHSTF